MARGPLKASVILCGSVFLHWRMEMQHMCSELKSIMGIL
uniref:Uncharacterized protein n=1 Tax=Rhizophora mucronata TaxID=61149 RepID=A0A2P2PDX5_RHIMU